MCRKPDSFFDHNHDGILDEGEQLIKSDIVFGTKYFLIDAIDEEDESDEDWDDEDD